MPGCNFNHIAFCSSFILFALLIACRPKATQIDKSHQLMFNTYKELNSAIRHEELDSVVQMLNPKSLEFYYKITDSKNLNLDSIVSIGMRYKVPYFSMKYLGSCGDFMRESSDPTDFFRFLAMSDISIFSNNYSYALLEEESRLEKDAFVAVYKKVNKVNKVNWVKFVRPDSSTYKYDLIYNLKLEERINRKIFKDQRKNYPKLSDEAFIKMYYPTFDKQNCGLTKNSPSAH